MPPTSLNPRTVSLTAIEIATRLKGQNTLELAQFNSFLTNPQDYATVHHDDPDAVTFLRSQMPSGVHTANLPPQSTSQQLYDCEIQLHSAIAVLQELGREFGNAAANSLGGNPAINTSTYAAASQPPELEKL